MRDTFALVPPEIRAMIEAEEYQDRQARAGKSISEALTAMDPGLDLVFVRHDAHPDQLPPGAVPGRWHVRNKDARPVPTFTPIQSPGGGYREPDSGILAEMADRDMRRSEVRERVYGRPKREKEERDKRVALEREQKRHDMAEDLRAGWRLPGTGGLTKRWRDKGAPKK